MGSWSRVTEISYSPGRLADHSKAYVPSPWSTASDVTSNFSLYDAYSGLAVLRETTRSTKRAPPPRSALPKLSRARTRKATGWPVTPSCTPLPVAVQCRADTGPAWKSGRNGEPCSRWPFTVT